MVIVGIQVHCYGNHGVTMVGEFSCGAIMVTILPFVRKECERLSSHSGCVFGVVFALLEVSDDWQAPQAAN